MLSRLKKYAKKRFSAAVDLTVRDLDLAAKSTYALKVAQRSLALQYQSMAVAGYVLPIDNTGYRIFSQFDEDGIFVFLFAIIGTCSKTFVDIGSSDGINSNCANLTINLGWNGLFIDGSEEAIRRGEKFYKTHPDTMLYPPRFVNAVVKRSNINQIIKDAGFSGEIDLLSIDIDGNDYWIWDALECIRPRVVCIETHVEFGKKNIVVPYDENYSYPGVHRDYHGASPVAMRNLAMRKGYRLVGSNLYGFNTIYLRNDLAADEIPEVTVEHILRHPRNTERAKLFEAVKHMPYVEG